LTIIESGIIVLDMEDTSENPVTKRRKALDMSGYRLAKLAGTTPSHIARIEEGAVKPGVEIALRIAAALGTTVEELFGAQQPEQPEPAEAEKAAS